MPREEVRSEGGNFLLYRGLPGHIPLFCTLTQHQHCVLHSWTAKAFLHRFAVRDVFADMRFSQIRADKALSLHRPHRITQYRTETRLSRRPVLETKRGAEKRTKNDRRLDLKTLWKLIASSRASIRLMITLPFSYQQRYKCA